MLETVIVVIMILFVVGFVGTRLAEWVHLPHSVFLVVLGIASGLILRYFGAEQVHELKHMFPEIILFLLLPPLIFESAYNFNLKDLKKDFVAISALAVVSLTISTAIIGFGFFYFFDFSLVASLTFGALISATDPVAVVAMFKQIGAPKRLNALVEGESLLNDGAAIVLYKVLIGFVAASAFQPSMITNGIVQFFIVALGGAFVGYIIYLVFSLLLRITNDSAAQLGLTVAAAYLSFLLADHFLHVSGVIATMVVGLLLGHKARLEFNKEAFHGMHYIWEFLALAANTIVFLAVGSSIDPADLKHGLVYILPTIGLVYLARAIGVFSIIPIVNATKVAKPIDLKYQTLLVWGGLRGGLALALVLLLPESFPYKQIFLALASAIVLTTLFVNALTVEWVLDKLKLRDFNSLEKKSYIKNLKQIMHKALHNFDKAETRGQYSSGIIEREKLMLTEMFHTRCNTQDSSSKQEKEFDRFDGFMSLLLHENTSYNHQLENGLLSKKAYINLIESVTERQNLLLAGEWENLFSYDFTTVRNHKNYIWHKFSNPVQRLTLKLEMLLHLHLTLEEILHLATTEEQIQTVKSWNKIAESSLEEFYAAYPDYCTAIQVQYISAAITYSADSQIDELVDSNAISLMIATRLKKDFAEAHKCQEKEMLKLLNPSHEFLLRRVSIFKEAPDDLIKSLCLKTHHHFYQANQEIVKEGNEGESFYLVTAGILQVQNEQLVKKGIIPRLMIGDFFGELSLLYSQKRNATVKAIIPSEVLEISKDTFNTVMENYPEIKQKIITLSNERTKKP